ncbi:MAG: hypothetical protein WCH62_00005, partial [Candidatus Omnitrophota bacterium]
GIAIGIVVTIVMLITMLVLFLITLLIAGIFALLLGQFKSSLLSIAVIFGVPYVLLGIVVLCCIELPVSVFFRTFSLYFLSSLNCGYMPLAFESFSPGAALGEQK